MAIDKPDDFWKINPWDNIKDFQIDVPNIKNPKRLRKVCRDFTLINQAQQWENRYFLKILDAAINSLNLPDGYKGTGRPSIPLSEKLKICCIKQYHLKSSRRTVYDIEYAVRTGYVFVPFISENYFNRINEYLRDESLTLYLQKLIVVLSKLLSKKERFFAIDGSGFKVSSGKSNYKQIRTNLKLKKEYVGLHIIIGIRSKIISHAIVARGYEHDNNFFKPLVLETNKVFQMDEVYADSAYLTNDNVNLCESLEIESFIKPKKNTIPNKYKNSAWNNSIDRFMADLETGADRRYSLRSNVECCYFMIKSVFSDVLRHRTFDGRVNELLSRVVCHNIRCLVFSYFKKDIKFPFE